MFSANGVQRLPDFRREPAIRRWPCVDFEESRDDSQKIKRLLLPIATVATGKANERNVCSVTSLP